MKKKKIFWIFIIMVGIISLVYGINYIFFSPTKINSFIASKIYKAPANKAFTDDNFYKCVVDAYNSKNRTSLAYTTNLSDEQLKTIERLSCSGKKIVSAAGVEKLTNLTWLDASSNQLTKIDVSKNTLLTELRVGSNKLTELDVSKNTALTELRVGSNKLTELDVSNNTALTELYVGGNQLTELDVSNNTALTLLDITDNSFSENMGIYKDGVFDNSSIDVSFVKLPDGKSSKFIGIQQNNKNIDEIDTTNVGGYQYDLLFRHDVSTYNNDYSVKLNLYVIELMSDKYYIDNENSYIYTKADVDKDTILNNVSLNYGEAFIEDNKLLIKYDDQVIKEFTIMNISSNKYNLNKDYIYVGTGDLDLDSINFTNGQIVVEDNKLKIKYNDKILQEYNLIKISSNKYYIDESGYIYTGVDKDEDTILNNISLSYGEPSIDDDKLLIKYNADILKKYLMLGVRFGTLQVNGKSIVISDDTLYYDFIDNITLSDGLTYKIFNGEDEVTSGNISKGMVLNIYYNDKVIDTYEVTDEYLDLSLLDVDEEKHLIKNLVAGTTVSELKKKISTSGTITVIDINNNVLDDEKLVTSGSKLEIKLSKKTYEYILSVRGDVNGDGKVTAADVSKMYRFVKKKISISEECYLLAGDVNDDGKISTADVSKVYRFVKKRINSLD